MSKRNKAPVALALVPARQETTQPAPAATTQPVVVMTDVFGNAYTEADLAPKAPAPKTVVKTAYKEAYKARAAALGRNDKASKRGNGDWLQRELQAETIGKDGKWDLGRFCAICEANGVENPLARWPNRSNGWEGRVRMSGSLVLRGIVGKTAVFRTPDTVTNLAELAEQGNEDAQAFLAKWAN
jgi:hypothetical protein